MAVTDVVELEEEVGSQREGHRPLMSFSSILMMNVGFFGVQFSFGLTQTAVNPLFTFIGAKPEQLPILNLAGPVTGLFIQPLIGAMSDRSWSPRWGRRRPFILAGAFLCVIILLLFPFVSTLWLGVLCLWLLDAGNNTSMEPYRALISDKLPKSQLARGFLTQSLFTGAGAVLANLSLFIFQKLLGGTAANGVPYWVYTCFALGAVCILATVLTAMLRTKEIPPSEEELAELRAAPRGVGHFVSDIAAAVREMPVSMHKIGLVFVFQWYAMFIYWQFVAVSVGESVFNTAPEQPGWDAAVGWSGLMNATYNFFTMVTALFLVVFCQRYGGKRVHAVCLGLAAVSLAGSVTDQQSMAQPSSDDWLGHLLGQYGRSSLSMVASMVPRARTGRLHGHSQHDDRCSDARGDFHFRLDLQTPVGWKGHQRHIGSWNPAWLAALAMLWVNPPHASEESDFMPLGRHHISVYERVIVGSDGLTPRSTLSTGPCGGGRSGCPRLGRIRI
jgi:maltose/moltooligosaccharide transporter